MGSSNTYQLMNISVRCLETYRKGKLYVLVLVLVLVV